MGLATAANPGADEAFALWSAANERLWSYDVIVHVRHFLKRSAEEEVQTGAPWELRQRFRAGQWRVDIIKFPEDRQSELPLAQDAQLAFAYDGKDMRTLSSGQNHAEIGDLIAFEKAKLHGMLYHELYASFYAGQRYVDALRPRNGVTVATFDGGLIIDAPPDRRARVSLNTFRVRVELSAGVGFMPSRVQVFGPRDGTSPTWEISSSFSEVLPRIWAPVKSQYTGRIVDAGRNLTGGQLVEVVVDKSRFNIEIPFEIFRLEAPPGTIVYDHGQKKNYVVAANGECDYDAYREQVQEAVEKMRQAHKPMESKGGVRRWCFVIANAVVLFIACTVLLWRRVRRTAKSL